MNLKELTFTQKQFDDIIADRLMRERDKHTESFNSLTAENGLLKGKLAEIEINSLVKEAGLAPEWIQKLTGKTPDEVKEEVQTIKVLDRNQNLHQNQ